MAKEQNQDLKSEIEEGDGLPQRWSERPWWWIVSALAAGLVTAGITLGAIQFIWKPLGLLVLAIAIAMGLAPLVERLTGKLSRTLAVLVIYLVLGLFVLGVGAAVTPSIVAQAEDVSERAPEIIGRAQNWLGKITDGSLTQGLTDQVQGAGSGLAKLPTAILRSLLDILVVIFLSAYWLMQLPAIKRGFLSLYPTESRGRVDDVLQAMGQSMGGFVRGTLINAGIVGVISTIFLLVMGLDFALVLGLLAGLLEVVPVIGPIIAGVLITGFAFLDSTTTGIIVLVFFVVMQQVENNILVPNIMRKQTDVSPLLVILALLIGEAAGGVLGMLVAIPIAAAGVVFMRAVVFPAIREMRGAGKRAAGNKG